MLKVTKLSITALIFYILFYQQVWGDNHLILYGTAAAAVLSTAMYCMRAGYLVYKNVPYGIWNNLILAIYAVATGFFVAPDFMVSFQAAIALLSFAAVCIAMCYASAEEGSFEWVLKVLIALALLCSIYTLIFGKPWRGYGITLSTANNPHTLAAVLSLGVFSVTYLARTREEKFSFVSAALILLFMFVTIRCGSRKYLLANALIIGVWIWAAVREGWKSGDSNRRIITALVVIGIAGAAFYIFHNVYLSSDSYARMKTGNDLGNQYRILYYKESWRIFLDHPFFGGGLDQFKYLSGTGNYAHSTYAEAIADFGFAGCALYFAPIIAVTCRIISRTLNAGRNYSDYLLLALCLSELFIGAMQIFFMEFNHFIVWSILFFYDWQVVHPESKDQFAQQIPGHGKYIR